MPGLLTIVKVTLLVHHQRLYLTAIIFTKGKCSCVFGSKLILPDASEVNCVNQCYSCQAAEILRWNQVMNLTCKGQKGGEKCRIWKHLDSTLDSGNETFGSEGLSCLLQKIWTEINSLDMYLLAVWFWTQAFTCWATAADSLKSTISASAWK